MFELTEEQLQRLGNLFIIFFKEKIRQRIYPYAPGYNGNYPKRGDGDKVASGQLVDSLSSEVVRGENGQLQLKITYMDYFKYVNLGRRPGRGLVPIPALLEWIGVRGINAVDRRGNNIPPLSLAFAIRNKIYRYGISPANIYDKTYDTFEDLLVDPPFEFQEEFEQLYNAIGADLENFFSQTIDDELVQNN